MIPTTITSKVEKAIKNYLILNEVLGSGAQATCKKAVLKTDVTQQFAVKIILKNTIKKDQQDGQKFFKRLEEEVKTLKQMRGANIVRYIDVCETANNIYLFLEFCNQGSLDKLVKKREGKLSELEAIQIFRQMKQACQELYDKNVVHRDLKPQNILIHNGQIKLADFGFARTMDDINVEAQMTLLGTPGYVSREILTFQKYSSKCDVYSLGVMMYEFLYGVHPYYPFVAPLDQLRAWMMINQLKFPSEPQIQNPYLKDLLQKMLGKTEAERIGWGEVFMHPFFTEYEKKQLEIQKQIEKNFQEQNIFEQQNQQFLEQNLVRQDFGSPLTVSSEQQQDIQADYQNSMFICMINEKELNNILNKYQNYEELINQMNKVIEYERNIAIFYLQILREFQCVQNQLQQNAISINIAFPFLYSIIKTGIIFINKIQNLTQSNYACLHSDPNLVRFFEQSQLYQSTNKNIEKDFFQLKQIFDSICKSIENIKAKIDCPDFRKFYSTSPENTQEFQQYNRKTYYRIYNELKKMPIQDQNILRLIRYIQIGLNPYRFFTNKGNTDFFAFYGSMQAKTSQQLLNEIKQYESMHQSVVNFKE